MADDWRNAPIVDAPSWQDAPIVPEPTKSEQASRRMSHLSIPAQVGEGLISVGGNMASMSLAGLAGANAASSDAMPGDFETGRPRQINTSGADVVSGVQQMGAEAFAPESVGGQKTVETIGKGFELAGKAIKYPLSAVPFAIAGLAPGGKTGSEERQEFMEMPMGDYLGELAQDSGASPLWATVAHMAPDIVLTAVGGKGYQSAKKSAKPTKPKPPTLDELKTEADSFYKLLDDSGITFADDVVVAKVNEMIAAVSKKGARKELTPNVIDALEILQKDAAAGRISLSKAEELRQVLKSGYGGKTADNARITQAIAMWDKFVTTISPTKLISQSGAPISAEATQWAKSARSLWSRKRKTETIDEIIRKAEIDRDAGTMTSGYSHSLRVQFRALAKNKKKMDLFTKAEQAAIRLAATGEPFERAMRLLGKLAPTNQISIMGDVAAGLGVGAMAGGPAGGAVGLSLPIVGGIARRVSNKRMESYATQASETMRRGN